MVGEVSEECRAGDWQFGVVWRKRQLAGACRGYRLRGRIRPLVSMNHTSLGLKCCVSNAVLTPWPSLHKLRSSGNETLDEFRVSRLVSLMVGIPPCKQQA